MSPIAFLCVALACASTAFADDKLVKYPVETALAKGQSYREKIDPAIRLYFGNPPSPPPAKTPGEADSGHRRTNAFNKPEQEACDIAFLSAAIVLQQQARRAGGNAVVNISGYFKNDRLDSASEYLCGAGFLMTAVGLRGTVVTLGE